MNIFNNNATTIGRTPIVRLNRIFASDSNVLVKIESRNPCFSVKCRIGGNMIAAAEKQGLLRTGIEIVEPTSGNTGIALAFVAAAKGYSLTLTMPETMSQERRALLAFLGARLELTPGAQGMSGAIKRAEEIVASDPKRFFMPQQFDNPANPEIHEKTTGPEIWEDTNGSVDVLVAGVGTGGTITGISRFIKNVKQHSLLSVAVEPSSSPVITQFLAGRPIVPSPHKIQGIGAGFIPKNLDLTLVDKVIAVEDAQALEFSKRLAKEEGILAGISAGAALAAVSELLKDDKMRRKTIVAILPDSAERYLSTALFQ